MCPTSIESNAKARSNRRTRGLAADGCRDAAGESRRDERVGAAVLGHHGLVTALHSPDAAGTAEHVDQVVDLVLLEDRDLGFGRSRLRALDDLLADLVTGQLDGAAVAHACGDRAHRSPPPRIAPCVWEPSVEAARVDDRMYPPGWNRIRAQRGLSSAAGFSLGPDVPPRLGDRGRIHPGGWVATSAWRRPGPSRASGSGRRRFLRAAAAISSSWSMELRRRNSSVASGRLSSKPSGLSPGLDRQAVGNRRDELREPHEHFVVLRVRRREPEPREVLVVPPLVRAKQPGAQLRGRGTREAGCRRSRGTSRHPRSSGGCRPWPRAAVPPPARSRRRPPGADTRRG